MRFRWTQMFGEHSLYFSNDEYEYEYRTYDAYFAKDVIKVANYQIGKAWNMTKAVIKVYKKDKI